MGDIEEIVREQEESVAARDAVTDSGSTSPTPRGPSGAPESESAEARGPTGGAPKVADATEDGRGAEVEVDLDELVKVGAQRDEYLALAQRTQADFENYRKRVARDAAAAQERGVAKLARELLPALDNLDRALDAADLQDPLLEGVRLVRAELAAALGRVGIESFAPKGEPFDPAKHEAIVQQPVQGAESGTVAEVYQAGYRLNGTIIRPARVVVAQ